MSEKWTPGPWAQSHRQRGTVYSTEVYDASGETIAILAWHPKRTADGVIATDRADNAALIAAAPELYAALEEMRVACAACLRVIARVNGLADILDMELRRAGAKEGFGTRSAAALAKARGEAEALPESRPHFPPNEATNAEGLTEEGDMERDRR